MKPATTAIRRRILKIVFREDFAEIFFLREGRELLGKKFRNFWFLLIIFFLTFFAIGFANGSLSYLEEKMKSPFIKWVSIDVPISKSEKIISIIKGLSEDTLAKKTYQYASVTGYNLFTLRFWDKKKNGTRIADGRSIDIGNPLLNNEIMQPSNLIAGRTFSSPNDIGIIVTKKLLKRLGNMPVDSKFIAMAFSDDLNPDVDREILIPIIAVVKELPDICEFLTTPYFQGQRFLGIDIGNPFNPGLARGVCLVTNLNEKKAEELKTKLEEFFSSHPEFSGYSPWVQVLTNEMSYKPCSQISITLLNDSSLRVRDNIYKAIQSIPEIKKNCSRFYDYTSILSAKSVTENKVDRITIEFLSLSQIGEFKEFLAKKYDILMDMAQVESKKNYNFVSSLTQIISLVLIAFSILSICLFVTNLLSNHLQKIKMNIGTFNAFGIDPTTLERIYLFIISSVISFALFSGILIAWGVGGVGGIRGILFLLDSNLEEGQYYFELFNWWTLISIVSVLGISFIALLYTSRKIFRQTPGDLIYDRI